MRIVRAQKHEAIRYQHSDFRKYRENTLSILNVEHLSHGFGDRAIFHDVSFRLLKGEHIGLIGANGEGKSTFMNIITGRLQPDEGKVESAPVIWISTLPLKRA